eukprot:4156295-Pyramimonas_sp.AAC.1
MCIGANLGACAGCQARVQEIRSYVDTCLCSYMVLRLVATAVLRRPPSPSPPSFEVCSARIVQG